MLYTETVNRAILAGSVIVGIAVMMSMAMIAPAFASPPWKDLYICEDGVPEVLGGTYKWMVKYGGCGADPVKVFCPTKRDTPGHMEFKDLNPYNSEYDYPDEQTRCHKDSSNWT